MTPSPRPALLLLAALLLAPCAPARSQDCRRAIDANQRQARSIEHSLRQLDALSAEVARMQAVNAAVFIEPDEALRATLLASLSARFTTLGARCDTPTPFDINANSSALGFVGGVRWLPWDLELQVFAAGRGDFLRLDEPAGAEPQSEVLARYRGLLGARLQVTRWFALGVARVADAVDDADDPALAGVLDDASAGPRWLYELAVPHLAASLRFTADGDQIRPSELAVRRVPLTDALRVGIEWAYISTEARHVLTPAAWYALSPRRSDGLGPGLDLWTEAAVESGALGLRHLRAGVRAPMLTTRITRTSYSRLGAHIEQRGALSLHRGAQLRSASATWGAIGAQWDIRLELRTPYLTGVFDFGLGFNVPEMLDLYPGLANSLTLDAGVRLGHHW